MFAGIYYGAMYGGSTTSILLNTPGESAIDRHGARGQQDGHATAAPARRSPPPRSARSSPARSARSAHAFSRRCVVDVALKFGPAEYFALMVLAFVTVSARARQLGGARADQPVPRPLARPGRHRPADRPGALHLRHARSCSTASTSSSSAVGLFAVGETLYVASRYRPRARTRSSRCTARSG